MIQQNYFISAFPHSRVLLQWAVAEYLALPEVAAVPGNGSRAAGSFPAWSSVFQHGGG